MCQAIIPIISQEQFTTFSGDLIFGNVNAGVNAALEGYIDAPMIWNRVLTSGEKTTLQTYTYPFN